MQIETKDVKEFIQKYSKVPVTTHPTVLPAELRMVLAVLAAYLIHQAPFDWANDGKAGMAAEDLKGNIWFYVGPSIHPTYLIFETGEDNPENTNLVAFLANEVFRFAEQDKVPA